jgi:hypothetical protein
MKTVIAFSSMVLVCGVGSVNAQTPNGFETINSGAIVVDGRSAPTTRSAPPESGSTYETVSGRVDAIIKERSRSQNGEISGPKSRSAYGG